LVRDPVEVLASHHRSTGRHMSGEIGFASFHPVFAALHSEGSKEGTLLDKQIKVLLGLLLEMNKKSLLNGVRLIDYQQLNEENLMSVLSFFGCGLNKSVSLKIQERMRFHSKSPGQIFVADKQKKQTCFTLAEQEKIRSQLMVAYDQLNNLAQNAFGIATNVH